MFVCRIACILLYNRSTLSFDNPLCEKVEPRLVDGGKTLLPPKKHKSTPPESACIRGSLLPPVSTPAWLCAFSIACQAHMDMDSFPLSGLCAV
ncbi:MAG: hypothetical protein ACI9TH_001887 [Kiritimatiellia bacterium]|jgi:hypothetical protein